MSLVHLEGSATADIKRLLAEQQVERPIRIQLKFSGCCDPSLELCVDDSKETDLHQEVEGLLFIMAPDVHTLAGAVTISSPPGAGTNEFVLTSERPVSEWEGFGTCSLKV